MAYFMAGSTRVRGQMDLRVDEHQFDLLLPLRGLVELGGCRDAVSFTCVMNHRLGSSPNDLNCLSAGESGTISRTSTPGCETASVESCVERCEGADAAVIDAQSKYRLGPNGGDIRLLVRVLGERHLDIMVFAKTDEVHLHAGASECRADVEHQVVEAVRGLAVDLRDDVAVAQARNLAGPLLREGRSDEWAERSHR